MSDRYYICSNHAIFLPRVLFSRNNVYERKLLSPSLRKKLDHAYISYGFEIGKMSFKMCRNKKLRIKSTRHIHDSTVFPSKEEIERAF